MAAADKKRIKILHADKFMNDVFKVKEGDIYTVVSEAHGEAKYGFLINTKNKKSIVVYRSEVEVIN